jgi:TPR repeat protein
VRRAGDADCQAKLGWFYEVGLDGVKEDHVQAIKWYRRVAEQGLMAAQMALATTYEGGYHVPQDYAEAAKWYQRAAERGDLDAQRKIAFFYWVGKGVPKDLVRAHMWANLTAAREQSRYQDEINAINAGPGTPSEKEETIEILRSSRQEPVKSAIETRNLIEREMTQAQIAEAQRLAREWKPTDAITSKAPAQ